MWPNRGEEVASEAFDSILRAVGNGHGPKANFRGYLVKAVRTTGINIGRRLKREVLTDWADLVRNDRPELAARDEYGPEPLRVAQAFRQLTPRWQMALRLAYLDKSPAEIAERMDTPSENAASALVYRARNALREKIAEIEAAEAEELLAHDSDGYGTPTPDAGSEPVRDDVETAPAQGDDAAVESVPDSDSGSGARGREAERQIADNPMDEAAPDNSGGVDPVSRVREDAVLDAARRDRMVNGAAPADQAVDNLGRGRRIHHRQARHARPVAVACC